VSRNPSASGKSSGSLTTGVQTDAHRPAAIRTVKAIALEPATRCHYLALVQRRTGQARFRETVLDAYSSRCTLCRLRHRELLDAAHIVSYAEGGTHQVSNGLAFCKFHHAAYDSDIVGVRPDGVAQVRRDVLEETDGPMLRHGLRKCTGSGCCCLGRLRCGRPWRRWNSGGRGFGRLGEGRLFILERHPIRSKA